ncbi:PstS family phosphate ABC transporter substrate-binding protein [Salibacterium qingdaonense]|uniref:Phosphate transport system substrate-binding protein n=1 Tax=Salibacterium qingdaonense TaxID=266892 RepID=A0A1I4NF14_9BACI|nr:substrate-binding domain-containing protein [Salibacterium qingdaonense]SFM14081.1 phosphate transport system substrate-binding protein [Salibacterium qingdaonense]
MAKRIVGMLAFTIIFGFAGAIAVFFSLLIFPQSGYIYVGIIAAAVLISGDLWILGVFSRVSIRMKVLIPLLLLVVPTAGYAGYDAYMSHIEIQRAEIDLTAYEPFHQNTKAASLDGTSDYTIEENLPALDGATALYPVYAAFARAVYPEDSYPHGSTQRSEVVVSKTNGAYRRLADGGVDMIFAAGPSDKQEEKLGPEKKQIPIGKEAFVFFVHKSNPVDSLTVKELRQIYAGNITNWEEVGGRDQNIIAFQRPEGSGSQTGLQNMMGETPVMDPPADQQVSGMGGIVEKTSDYRNHRNAIGFSYRYFATEMVENNGVKLLKVNNVKPDKPSIQQDQYPLTSEFYAITNGSDNPHLDSFITWILSDQGQSLIEKTGYVPISERKELRNMF